MTGTSNNKNNVTFDSSLPTRWELVFLAGIVLLGVVLRCAWPSHVAVEHFDEGIYASNVWFGAEDGFRYPLRHFFAPPLFPWLVEWSILFLGPSHLGSFLIPLLFGVLTIPLMWWVARSWFGREAGLAAAALAALSDVHILYTRTVLTDVPLCFWLLLAVYLIGEAYRSAHLRWILAAGIATGLAWCTKYNGWLPLTIGLAGLIPWLFFNKRNNRPTRTYFLCWIGIALVACVVWSPAWYDLQQAGRGGYAAVAANHRGYLVGLDGWPDALLRQVANLRYLDGWASVAGVGVAVLLPSLLPVFSRRRSTWNSDGSQDEPSQMSNPARKAGGTQSPVESRRRTSMVSAEWLRTASWAVLALACAALVGSSVFLGLIAVVGIAIWLRAGRSTTNRGERSGTRAPGKSGRFVAGLNSCELSYVERDADERGPDNALPCWLLAAWFCGLSVSTPFYTPYPRLTLPWLMSAWLGTAAAVGWWHRPPRLRKPAKTATTSGGIRLPAWGVAVLCLTLSLPMLGWSASRLSARGVPGWQARNGLEAVATEIARDVGRSTDEDRSSPVTGQQPDLPDFILYVYAEPALVFHLSAIDLRTPHSRFIVQPVGDLSFAEPDAARPPVPTFLVTRPLARRNQTVTGQLTQYRDQLPRVRTYRYTPSDLVLLNDYPPRDLAGGDIPKRETIVGLYRLK